ncbi:GAF domain-containing protein [Brevibacterium sanguinis]|uniref:GAF domain-containing protein n=2 Tax=Brevibacterium TaxID=1696 RepID=A0A366II11_9MICO|nr:MULTISPECIES: GAF domain-containing protein [Brevibacterium]RBP64215.1 GAF domain-containing protein [Brevibacterium sanguinis]RBP71493.1 GAF domain-containing protein [Brevibacterium celere]
MPVRDLAALARTLERIHGAVVSGQPPPSGPRSLVARSWERMIALGIDPDGRNARVISDPGEVESRRRSTRLRFVVDELVQTLLRLPDAADLILVIADADGVILWRDGAVGARRRADGLGFVEGAHWTESIVGTNAIGTALAEEAPVQLFSAEHFETSQHPWFCSAVPVHDPGDGSLLGIVDISGPAFTLQPTMQALVTTAVRLAEARLQIHRQTALMRLRDRYATLLAGTTGPIVIVDDDGWVALAQGILVKDRIEAPDPGRAVHLPGAGPCLPERIDGGWILRPGGSARLRVRVSAGSTSVQIESDNGVLRVPLTQRRRQIVEEITRAGRRGTTAKELSRRLYGDDEHVVTVRAEVSRLRRSLGALLTTQPYRWSDEIDILDERATDRVPPA